MPRALGLSCACAASASFFGGTAFCVAPSRWSGGWEMSSPNPRSAGTNGNEAREGSGARQRRRRKNARAGPSLPPKKNLLVVGAAPRGTRLGDGGGQFGRREGRANGGGGPSNSVSVRKVDGTSHSESMREERSSCAPSAGRAWLAFGWFEKFCGVPSITRVPTRERTTKTRRRRRDRPSRPTRSRAAACDTPLGRRGKAKTVPAEVNVPNVVAFPRTVQPLARRLVQESRRTYPIRPSDEQTSSVVFSRSDVTT